MCSPATPGLAAPVASATRSPRSPRAARSSAAASNDGSCRSHAPPGCRSRSSTGRIRSGASWRASRDVVTGSRGRLLSTREFGGLAEQVGLGGVARRWEHDQLATARLLEGGQVALDRVGVGRGAACDQLSRLLAEERVVVGQVVSARPARRCRRARSRRARPAVARRRCPRPTTPSGPSAPSPRTGRATRRRRSSRCRDGRRRRSGRRARRRRRRGRRSGSSAPPASRGPIRSSSKVRSR